MSKAAASPSLFSFRPFEVVAPVKTLEIQNDTNCSRFSLALLFQGAIRCHGIFFSRTGKSRLCVRGRWSLMIVIVSELSWVVFF